ncbi:MAG: acyltransferase [Muribaculaceae bacterium]
MSKLKGEVILDTIRTGIVKIGFGDVGIFDKSHSRTIWQVSGKVVFNGKANIGHGSKISVHPGGILKFGDKFAISAESSIVCSKHISFGMGCLLSWDILIMDTDLHKIYSDDGRLLNISVPIVVEDYVWIGCRASILKGAIIASGCVIGAGAVITKSCLYQNAIYVGNNKLVKTAIRWGN